MQHLSSSIYLESVGTYVFQQHRYYLLSYILLLCLLQMDNPFISCPYNPTHQVSRSRIQGHIVKCAKKYPTLEICPYNASHRFPKSEQLNHISDCPNKVLQVGQHSKNILTTKPKMVNQYFAKPGDPDYECWD